MKLENSLVHMEFLTFSVLKKVGYINSNAYDEDFLWFTYKGARRKMTVGPVITDIFDDLFACLRIIP